MAMADDPPEGARRLLPSLPIADALFGWTRAAGAGRRVMWALLAVGLLLVASDFVFLRRGYFPLETIPGFHALFGFLAFSAAVLCGWPLGRWLRRPEAFYDRPSEDRAEEERNG
jgi:hypothetical protein